MNKYDDLVQQVKNELYWAIEGIKDNEGIEIPHDIALTDWLGSEWSKQLDEFNRGLLFGYLSILSKVKFLDEEEAE